MNTAAVAAVPLIRVPAQSAPRLLPRFVLGACLLSVALMLALNLWRRESYTADEGFYGVAAQNMLLSSDYLIRPSYHPAGDFVEDRDGFAHPPVNSYFYAAALWLAGGSLAGPEVFNALCFAALLWLVYRLTARFDRGAAAFATLLLAASGPMAGYYAMLEAEPLMVLFGLMGIEAALRGGFAPGRHPWFFVAGLGAGMAFVLKLWLCGPVGLAIGAALALRAWEDRPGAGRALLATALFALGGLLPSALHLGAVALAHPEDLLFWVRNIYFGLFTHSGISGAKMGGAAMDEEWLHPIWYYGAALYRDHFFLAPLLAFGAGALWSQRSRHRRALIIVAAGLAGLAPLSLMRVKEPLYVLSCAVFLYVLAGLCLAAIARRLAARQPIDRAAVVVGSVLCLGLTAAVLGAYGLNLRPDDVTPRFVAAHSASLLGGLGLLLWANQARSARRVSRGLVIACVAGILATFGWKAATERGRDAAIATLLAPRIADQPPGAIVMLASNYKSYQNYTFHRGRYIHDLPADVSPADVLAQPEHRHVRAFLVSEEDIAEEPVVRVWLAWLERNADEITADVERRIGQHSEVRVFVPRPTPPPAA